MGRNAKVLWANFQKFNCVQALRPLLLDGGSFYRKYLSVVYILMHLESHVNGCDGHLIKDFSSAPFNSVLFTFFINNFSLNSPESLGNKLFDLFSLIDDKSKCGCLAWSVS
jgi:hypothetical protein